MSPKHPAFHFVNVDGRKPRAYQTGSRAHVMRKVARDRDDEREKRNREMEITKAASAVDLHRTVDMQHVNHCEPLASDRKRDEFLADLWLDPDLNTYARSFLPMTSTDQSLLFQIAMADEGCYLSMLSVSQAHQASISGRTDGENSECLRHKVKALKCINDQISRPQQYPDNGTILAIAWLCAYENLFGSRDAATSHAKGLVTICHIKVTRGGFRGVELCRILERLVQWVELSNATARVQRSAFQGKLPAADFLQIGPADLRPSLTALGSPHSKTQVPSTLDLNVYKGMTPAAASMFKQIQGLARIRARTRFVRELDADTLYLFMEEVNSLERRINTEVSDLGSLDCCDVEKCLPVYSAMLCIIYVALRDMPVSSPIFDNFTRRARLPLDELGLEANGQHFSVEFLFWLLMLMTWLSKGRQVHEWYLSAAKWVTGQLNFSRWEQAKQILDQYCMVDSICESPFQQIWLELGHQL